MIVLPLRSLLVLVLLLCGDVSRDTVVKAAGYEAHSGMFDPQGRLPPLDFATRAIDKHGGPVCAFTTTDGICVITATPRSSSKSSTLVVQEEVQKVQLVDQHVLVAISGQSTEIHLPSLLKIHQNYRLQYGQPIPVEMLCEDVAEFFNLRCRKSGSFPLRCKLLVCGFDAELGYQIYSILPDGSYDAWKGIAIGKDSGLLSQSLVKLQESGLLKQSLAQLWPTVTRTLLDKFFFKKKDTSLDDSDKAIEEKRKILDDDYEVEVFVLSKALDDDDNNNRGGGEEASKVDRSPRWRKVPVTSLY